MISTSHVHNELKHLSTSSIHFTAGTCEQTLGLVDIYTYIYVYKYIWMPLSNYSVNNQWYFESCESSTDCYKQKSKKVYTNWIITR